MSKSQPYWVHSDPSTSTHGPSSALCVCTHDSPRMALAGLRVCASHQRRTRDAIAVMPALYYMLDGYLTGQEGAYGERVSSSPTPGLQINENVSTARRDILNHLHCWARIGINEGPWHDWPTDAPKTIADWITRRIDWYLAAEWADEFVRESLELRRTALRLRQPSTVKRFEVGPCPEPDCQGTLITEIRQADDLLPSLIWCDLAPMDEDGEQVHVWTPDKWLLMGKKVHRAEEESA